MKKIFLLVVFTVFQLVIFAQLKHITYTNPITVNTVSYLDYFKVAASTNNDGYFLATRFDDGSYFMKHYIAKADFTGNVVWDTVYYFDEPYSTSTTSINSIASKDNELTIVGNAAGVNSNGRYQPFIYNLDNSGNINWNKYFDIDTLEFNNPQVLFANDGGYVLFGGVSDYSSSPLSGRYGFVYKLDPAGVLEWSKFYTDKDTAEFGFEAGAATLDDKFIFAGDADNEFFGGGKTLTPEPWDNFVNVVCVDATGNMLWNSALLFETPVSNNYFTVKSVTVIDALTAIVGFQYYNDTTSYNETGLASINISDGVVNWVKGFGLASDNTDMNLRKVIKMNNGNIVVFYDEYSNDSKSDLLELDYNGNIIQAKTIQEYTGSNTFYHDIIPTEDGGSFIAAGFNIGTGLIAFKTDKNLKTHCPEEYMSTIPSDFSLVYDVYEIADTVFDVSPIEGSLINNTGPEINTSLGFPCSCELTLSGNITYSSTFADSVMVYLYKVNANGAYTKRDSVETDVAGYFQFLYLPEGNYIVKAVPSQTKYPTYLPTFFDVSMGSTQWSNAFVLSTACGNNPMPVNIDLLPKLPQTGTWKCNGYVLEYYGYNSGLKLAPGDPIPDIDITVEQSPGGSINSATTDQNGFYQFTGLNNNATFIVRANIPGLPNDSVFTLVVNPGDGMMDSLNFYVDTVGVYILPQYILTGVNLLDREDLKINILPNPTKSNFALELSTKLSGKTDVSLINNLGQVLYSSSNNMPAGINRINFDISEYPEGIYFLRISSGSNHIVKKIIKQ
ncbi:MAG: T9SS type A sorting domain-containing protein [Flavobacteriales bacterium]